MSVCPLAPPGKLTHHAPFPRNLDSLFSKSTLFSIYLSTTPYIMHSAIRSVRSAGRVAASASVSLRAGAGGNLGDGRIVNRHRRSTEVTTNSMSTIMHRRDKGEEDVRGKPG